MVSSITFASLSLSSRRRTISPTLARANSKLGYNTHGMNAFVISHAYS